MLRIVLSVLILLAGVAGFIALKESRPVPQSVEPREHVWRVAVMEAQPGEHRPVLALFGQVEAPDRIRASAPTAGRLLEVKVRDGDRVDAGALLARLDPVDTLHRLRRARAEVERERLRLVHDREALAQERQILSLAEAAVERAGKVQAKQLASQSSVDEAREQLARAELAVTLRQQSIAEHPARLAALEATLAEVELDAQRAEIRAPFAARIGSVEAAAGDQIKANEPILTFYPVDGLYLRAKIPGVYSEELRSALAAGEQLTATGHHAGQAVSAVLERLAGEADARGVDALLRLAADAKLPLGAFVDLQLERPSVAQSIALPFAALHGGDRVFTVEDGRLHAVAVQRIGELAAGGQVLVRAPGLAAGSRVMVTHLPNAMDSLKVEILP